jgi:hypothetical protein
MRHCHSSHCCGDWLAECDRCIALQFGRSALYSLRRVTTVTQRLSAQWKNTDMHRGDACVVSATTIQQASQSRQ